MAKVKSRLDRVLPQVPSWVSDAWPISGTRLQKYVSGDGGVGHACTDMFDYGMQAIRFSLLAAYEHNSRDAIKQMTFGFVRNLFSEIVDLRILTSPEQLFVGTLDDCTHTMLGVLALGKSELVSPYYQTVFDCIEKGYGLGNGHNPPVGTTLRYAAFGLTIIGDWLGKPLDLDKHALPRDPAWGQLVAHWREPDPEKFLPVLLSACDTHVERIAVTEREANQQAKQFEFNSVFLAVHPTEILAVLRLREIIGLTNPAHIDHPLMQTPYAAITSLPGEVTERDELLDRFLEVVRQRDPQVLPPGL
ncbi:hypothetical protein [Pectobacterium carotovorum]|uniref:hypothetical protein n=1 Tax=Pectobacterium carotovorum TaxID=554 RepID=UPI002FFEBB32